MKKLFKETDLTLKKIIIFAIITGLYTGIVTLIPILKNTSFRDISISFEWWILFGIFIILNSKSPLDSAIKCFIFFLISQPLVYLVQVPFKGLTIFSYYKLWIVWTILTFPMGYIGHYLKKDKWYGLLILTPILIMLGIHYEEFLNETITYFPYHLLSAIFCILTIYLYPLVTFENKKIKITGIIISSLIIIIASIYAVNNNHIFYSTDVLVSSEENNFDDTYSVSLEDESYGNVSIIQDISNDVYLIHGDFKKPGTTILILSSPNNETTTYKLTIEKNTYEIIKE